MKVISVNDEQYGILGVMGKGGSSEVSTILFLNPFVTLLYHVSPF